MIPFGTLAGIHFFQSFATVTIEDFRLINSTLPDLPGVYRFIDEGDALIYVGKAKNLKKRITSYFVKNHQNYKTNVMVRNALRIEYTIVETEQDALLLENTLIKNFQPRYNINLKDDKSYPFICIKKENFPRVFLTRTSKETVPNISGLILRSCALKGSLISSRRCIPYAHAT
jgi:excinuclease UvrABC nuclease subunit